MFLFQSHTTLSIIKSAITPQIPIKTNRATLKVIHQAREPPRREATLKVIPQTPQIPTKTNQATLKVIPPGGESAALGPGRQESHTHTQKPEPP